MMKICEICKKESLILEEQHIQSRSKNGSNKKFNLTDLCQNCHKLVHLGLVIIEGYFKSTGGTILVWRKFNKESITNLPDPEVYLLPNYKKYQEIYLKNVKE